MADPITIADYTDTTVSGDGVFDVMARAFSTHIAVEHDNERIKGQEYATVYLGGLQSVMNLSLEFLLQRDKLSIELDMLEIQQAKLEIEKDQATAQLALIEAQTAKTTVEISLVTAEVAKADAEKLRIDAATSLTVQQEANAVLEGTVLAAQECKLRAEFNLLVQQAAKSLAETGLLTQKKVTEQAQTSSAAVDADSVIGKQATLYGRQADGFLRDAEQKATKIMVDSWNVRRTTDEGTQANALNKLQDEEVGAAVLSLLAGINATLIP